MIDANARTAQRRWTADTRGRLRTYGHRTSGTVDIGTPPDRRSHTIVHDNGPPPTEKPKPTHRPDASPDMIARAEAPTHKPAYDAGRRSIRAEPSKPEPHRTDHPT